MSKRFKESPNYYHKVQDWDLAYVIRYNKNMTTLSLYRGNSCIGTLIYDFNPSKPLITNCSYYYNNIEESKNTFKSFEHQ